jgi:hypothetical protein
MNIRLTTDAANQLDMMRFTRHPQTGFVVGDRVGTFIMVKLLVPAPLDSSSLQRNYPKALEVYGPSLLGVFFIGREPFIDGWFSEDLVLAADDNRLDSFVCEATDTGLRMKRIVHREENQKHG